jgi:hypothetical protein
LLLLQRGLLLLVLLWVLTMPLPLWYVIIITTDGVFNQHCCMWC